MAKKSSTLAPRLEKLCLENLVDGDAAALVAHESYVGARYSDSDISEVELSGASFSECEFRAITANVSDFRTARFVDTSFIQLNAPLFKAPRSQFRDVTLEGSRLGAAEFYGADWRSVRFVNCRLGYVNLRGAQVQDVQFVGCTIDELDLGGATAKRVAFESTQVDTLDLTGSTLQDVDLRSLHMRQLIGLESLKGATLTSSQITALAESFAAHLGIHVED